MASMRLPRAEFATIHPNKLLGYLLDPSNPASRGKPTVFFGMGYTREMWGSLSDDLRKHGQSYEVVDTSTDRDGIAVTYTIDGDMTGPNGRSRRIRTVWRVDGVDENPRLITAFPAPRPRLILLEGGRNE
jgi:hypothetical protein